ncbi:MAG TPA: hypothetical protein VG604_01080 [Candidatus Saccharimonadales bacterium]|nr:hypothetical protein [Candidatus Saccharimonadales bacterium]
MTVEGPREAPQLGEFAQRSVDTLVSTASDQERTSGMFLFETVATALKIGYEGSEIRQIPTDTMHDIVEAARRATTTGELLE